MRLLGFVALMWFAMAARGAEPVIAGIDFFGYDRLDVDGLRAALPLKPGDPWSEEGSQRLRDFVRSVLGNEATDIAAICCEKDGNPWIYIGLPGTTSRSLVFSPAPQEPLSASPELLRIGADLDAALQAAVARGGDAITEDRSQGYALQTDPDSRALQLRLREYAVAHGPEILAVLASSSNASHRAVAATAVGYMTHSATQIRALSAAMFDPDPSVRNDATRALLVLVGSGIELAEPIPAAPFVDLMYSRTWTDRNKASGALMGLTQSRDPHTLSQIRERGLAPIVEIARWGSHQLIGILVLGRAAGIDDAVIFQRAEDPTFIDFCLDRITASAAP